MRLNETHPYVKLVTNVKPEQVTSIYMGGHNDRSGSQIHTFTSDICNTFPSLEEIDGHNLGLQRIMDGAFDNCAKLTEIRLSNNLLTEFSTKNWHPNQNLKYLFLDGNNLQNIDRGMLLKTFPCLEKIMLSRNGPENNRFTDLKKRFELLNVTVVFTI